LICENLKNLTKILGKLLKELEENNLKNKNDLSSRLTKIKLFLKLSRVLKEKANDEANSCLMENERNLYTM
jgi:hypothetical protein